MSKSQVRKKDALAQALLALLHHEAVEKITVDQLCREANVQRSTFYRYFQDKYDLLHYVFQTIWLEQIDENNVVDSMIEMIVHDKDIFRNISINNSNNSLYALMIDMVAEQILEASLNNRLHNILWIEETVLNATDQKLAADMIAGAFLTLLFKWVDSNYQMSSTELSDFIKHLH